jgi:hypothetical protein
MRPNRPTPSKEIQDQSNFPRLSNFVNCESTHSRPHPFKSRALMEHSINVGTSPRQGKGQFIIPVPAQMQTQDALWYQGNRERHLQNAHLHRRLQARPRGGFRRRPHLLDGRQPMSTSNHKGAVATVSAHPVPWRRPPSRRHPSRTTVAASRLPQRSPRKNPTPLPNDKEHGPRLDGPTTIFTPRHSSFSRRTTRREGSTTTSA